MIDDPYVVAIIATYQRLDELRRLLRSLESAGPALRAIIVVDNANDSALLEGVDSTEKVRWVGLSTNRGCGAALREGESFALHAHPRATHLWILDDDVVVPAGTLGLLLEAMQANDAAIACPFASNDVGQLDFYPGLADRRKHRGMRQVVSPEEFIDRFGASPTRFTWTTGTCLLVARCVFVGVGLHRDDYWIRGEDLEFSLRVTTRYRGILVPAAVIFHLPPGPRPGGGSSTSKDYRRHCALVQNTTYTAVRIPHGRALLWILPGTYRHFFRDWKFSLRSVAAAFALFWRGAVRGQPAGATMPYVPPLAIGSSASS